jgi:hypothetical protein
VDETLLTDFLTKKDYTKNQISKALYEFYKSVNTIYYVNVGEDPHCCWEQINFSTAKSVINEPGRKI